MLVVAKRFMNRYLHPLLILCSLHWKAWRDSSDVKVLRISYTIGIIMKMSVEWITVLFRDLCDRTWKEIHWSVMFTTLKAHWSEDRPAPQMPNHDTFSVHNTHRVRASVFCPRYAPYLTHQNCGLNVERSPCTPFYMLTIRGCIVLIISYFINHYNM